MSVWNCIFVFYLVAVVTVGSLVWYRCSRPNNFTKEFVCDGCGQVCTTLKDGLCVYCDNHFKPLPKRAF